MDGPGADFFFASSEIALEAKCFVGSMDELVESRLVDTVTLEKFAGVCRVE